MQVITQAELARDPQRVLDAVRRGEPAFVENEGGPAAAIVDIVDYRILRAVARFQAEPPVTGSPDAGLRDEAVAGLTDAQAQFDLVIGHYLAEAISLARAAELLGQASLDLRGRFDRLGAPIRMGPATIEELRDDIAVAETARRAPRG